jgi:hypothetical protein
MHKKQTSFFALDTAFNNQKTAYANRFTGRYYLSNLRFLTDKTCRFLKTQFFLLNLAPK